MLLEPTSLPRSDSATKGVTVASEIRGELCFYFRPVRKLILYRSNNMEHHFRQIGYITGKEEPEGLTTGYADGSLQHGEQRE